MLRNVANQQLQGVSRVADRLRNVANTSYRPCCGRVAEGLPQHAHPWAVTPVTKHRYTVPEPVLWCHRFGYGDPMPMDTSAALSSSTLRVRRWRERQREERQENALFRIATCMIRAHAAEQTLETAAKKLYGKDHGLDLIWRAVSNPATLTNPGWADTVGHNVVRSDLIQKITGLSAAAALMESQSESGPDRRCQHHHPGPQI